MMEQSWESEQPPGGAPAPAPETRLRPPPPLTHEDNRGFLEMLREKKERYGLEQSVSISHASGMKD
jgi:hypothetical protein